MEVLPFAWPSSMAARVLPVRWQRWRGAVLRPGRSGAFADGGVAAAQVEELKSQLQESSDSPVTLIGFSWGAWLSLLLAAQYPRSGQQADSDRMRAAWSKSTFHKIMETRLSRLSRAERDEVRCILAALEDRNDDVDREKEQEKKEALARMGELFRRADAFDPD